MDWENPLNDSLFRCFVKESFRNELRKAKSLSGVVKLKKIFKKFFFTRAPLNDFPFLKAFLKDSLPKQRTTNR